MFLKCEKKLILDNINLVQKAVSNKSTLPILECFLLVCDEDGFRMSSTDLEIGIKTYDINCEIIEKGSIALPSKFFSDIIRKMPEGMVSIQVKEKFVTIIKCNNTEFKIIGRDAEEFPALMTVENANEYKVSQKIFKDLIRQTIFSICQDESKPNLMGALLEIDDENIRIVTCDSFRVSYRSDANIINAAKISEAAILPTKAVNEIYKLLLHDDDDLTVCITKKHIMFDTGLCTLVSRLIEGEFINYENIFKQEFESKVIVSRESFADAVDRASLVSSQDEKKKPIKFKIEEKIMLVTSVADLGNSYDEVDIDLDGKELEIAFNPKFILDAVKAVDGEQLSIEFNSPLSPCVIKPISQTNNKYLILPLRIKS